MPAFNPSAFIGDAVRLMTRARNMSSRFPPGGTPAPLNRECD